MTGDGRLARLGSADRRYDSQAGAERAVQEARAPYPSVLRNHRWGSHTRSTVRPQGTRSKWPNSPWRSGRRIASLISPPWLASGSSHSARPVTSTPIVRRSSFAPCSASRVSMPSSRVCPCAPAVHPVVRQSCALPLYPNSAALGGLVLFQVPPRSFRRPAHDRLRE